MTTDYGYQHGDGIEICVKVEDRATSSSSSSGDPAALSRPVHKIYYPASFLAPFSLNQCLAEYRTVYTEEKTLKIDRFPIENIRPLPPHSTPTLNFDVPDLVDVWIESTAWYSGQITRKDNLNYHVKMDGYADVLCVPFYRMRYHLEWEDGEWIRSQNESETSSSSAGDETTESDENK